MPWNSRHSVDGVVYCVGWYVPLVVSGTVTGNGHTLPVFLTQSFYPVGDNPSHFVVLAQRLDCRLDVAASQG